MAKTYEPISTQTLVTATAAVTFSSIPQTYTDLILVFNGYSDRTTDNVDAIECQFNLDTATNYSFTRLAGNGTSATSIRSTTLASISVARMNGALSNTSFGMANIQFPNYSNTTTFQTVLGRSSALADALPVYASVGLYRSTAAITSIKLFPAVGPNFKSGSTFTLYGIKAA